MSQPLRDGEYLHQALADGKAFILLDGIDEIGDLSVRKGLREAVFDGFARHPDCRWLLSSRIVGYDEAPFERRPEPQDHLSSSRGLLHEDYRAKLFRPEDREMLEPRELRETTGRVRGLDDGPVMTRYIAPFDDRRIEAFARNWYLQREAAATRAGADAMHLVRGGSCGRRDSPSGAHPESADYDGVDPPGGSHTAARACAIVRPYCRGLSGVHRQVSRRLFRSLQPATEKTLALPVSATRCSGGGTRRVVLENRNFLSIPAT